LTFHGLTNRRYVEDGLNPDKYTRRFVNMLLKDNQYVNGKIDAVQVFLLLTVLRTGFSRCIGRGD
jgi:hypothetical protein